MPHQRPIEERAFGSLARFALDVLYAVDQEEGCCPICCAPCSALWHLRRLGRLNDIVARDPGTLGSAWWKGDSVDDEFLRRAWRMTECHE